MNIRLPVFAVMISAAVAVGAGSGCERKPAEKIFPEKFKEKKAAAEEAQKAAEPGAAHQLPPFFPGAQKSGSGSGGQE